MNPRHTFLLFCGLCLALPHLAGCSPQAESTSTPSVPALEAVTTETLTGNPDASSPMEEQAQSFGGPILSGIVGVPPDFEDDFTGDTGWTYFASPCPFGSEAEMLHLQLGSTSCAFTNDALSRKDFVLQFDSRMQVGDDMSLIQVNYHHKPTGGSIYQLAMSSTVQSWSVIIYKELANVQVAQGTSLLSPLGEFTHVQIIARGSQSAIYINGTPAAYFEDPEFDEVGRTWFSCTSYYETVCDFDNIQLWELAKVP